MVGGREKGLYGCKVSKLYVKCNIKCNIQKRLKDWICINKNQINY